MRVSYFKKLYLFITTSKDSESIQPSQCSQHLPDKEQPREIGEQELRRLDDEWKIKFTAKQTVVH